MTKPTSQQRDDAGKALYDRWRSTDAELKTEWADAPDTLRGVFLRHVDTVTAVFFPDE